MPLKSPKHLYHKLLYRYTAIIICIVAALMVYFVSATRNRIRETNQDYMQMMSEKAVSYLKGSMETAGVIHSELYQSPAILKDLLHYFQLDDEAYQKYRLNTFMESPSNTYEGFDGFLEKALESNGNLAHVELISYERSELTDCYPQGKIYRRHHTLERLSAIEQGNLASPEEFGFLKEIRDPDTMQSKGCMIFYFEADEFAKIQDYYKGPFLVVYNQAGTLIFDSTGKIQLSQLLYSDIQGSSGEELGAYFLKSDVQDYVADVYFPKSAANRIPLTWFLTILGIGIGVIVIGEWFVHRYLKNLGRRLQVIVNGMHQVMTGDLNVRLHAETNGDELDVISENFNEMCLELDRYIKKSYLAEIEQKNAEMEALQSQINPHFLYNTLEAIRMKAIINGDREVGKMLYSMAVIFRSQLKEKDFITVIQEIHYCKKYLELFEYRYQGKFTSHVDCPEELMNYPIMKFILQPVLENYFIHGIRGEAEGNEISISVEKEQEAILIHVSDNGQGMSEERLKQKNEDLRNHKMKDKKSVGLSNVNRRIQAVYGEDYGLTLKAGSEGGIHVVVKVGLGEDGG